QKPVMQWPPQDGLSVGPRFALELRGTKEAGRQRQPTLDWYFSLLASCLLFRLRRIGFDGRHCAVALREYFIGYASDIGLAYNVDAIDLAEEFAPVAVVGLVIGQLSRQSHVVAQVANQVGFGAGADRLQLFIAYVSGFQAFDLFVNRRRHFFGSVPRRGHREEEEEAGIFVAWKSSPLGSESDLLIAYQRAVETRGPALGEK